MLDDCIGCTHSLEEIPTVIGVVPSPATDIVISCAGELLIGKTVCIAAEVSRSTGHRFIVEVIMTVHVPDDIVAAHFHLATRVSRAVYVKIFEEAVTAFVVQVVLSGITQSEVLEVQIGTTAFNL